MLVVKLENVEVRLKFSFINFIVKNFVCDGENLQTENSLSLKRVRARVLVRLKEVHDFLLRKMVFPNE